MAVKLTAAERKKLGIPHVSNNRLLKYAKEHKPAQSWYDEPDPTKRKRKRGKVKTQNETVLVKQILEWLHLKGLFAWRNNTGAFAGEHNGKKRFVRFGIKGGSDIFGIAPGGRFLAIECKVGWNKTTDDQRDFLWRVEQAGGMNIVARELDDVVSVFQDMGW